MVHSHLVSVIIPVYNCERYLGEAVESVLAQTYRSIEIIVVDDGSTDNTASVARRFVPSVRYIFQTNSGAGAARNRGVNLARGSYLAFLDADDLWVEDKLTRQIAELENDPELDMVFGHVNQFHSPELDNKMKSEAGYGGEDMPGYHVGTMLIKKKSFFCVGIFDINWQLGEFIDWYSRAMAKGLKNIMLPQVVYKRRLHVSNLGIRKSNYRMDYVRILKMSLDRRRMKDSQDSAGQEKI